MLVLTEYVELLFNDERKAFKIFVEGSGVKKFFGFSVVYHNHSVTKYLTIIKF